MTTKAKHGGALRCINPHCNSIGKKKFVRSRGLCGTCYRALLRLIEVGRISWEQAEEQGLCRKQIPVGFRRFPQIADPHFGKVNMRQARGVALK